MTKISDLNKYWNEIFDDYDVLRQIDLNGSFIISSAEIKKYKEARLMTKFDCANQLPDIMRTNDIGILPITRGSYILGRFNCFEEIPVSSGEIKKVDFPNWIESINVDCIYSEELAINTALIAPIFTDFFDEKEFVSTISGRMKTGVFDFAIGNKRINVNNSQMEIDGSLESKKQFVLIEAKNIIHDDFMVRQLYFPFRRFHSELTKPVKTIFMIYSNGIFRLLEYKFEDLHRYDSIKLLRDQKYSVESTSITENDLDELLNSTIINDNNYGAPFPQCDDFSKIISLIEQLQKKEMSKEEIKELFGFVSRQADYYFNGVRYLGFADIDKGRCFLTEKGKKLLEQSYKTRQLLLAKAIIEKTVFNKLLKIYLQTKEVPDNNLIFGIMGEYSDLQEPSMIKRRASTVKSWLNWIILLTK